MEVIKSEVGNPDLVFDGRDAWASPPIISLDLTERIKLYIDKMDRDGRCMIHLNQIPAKTPPEHVHAAIAACHAYGRLPFPRNLDDINFEMPMMESFSEFMQNKGEPIVL
jgi:hypothetical protein